VEENFILVLSPLLKVTYYHFSLYHPVWSPLTYKSLQPNKTDLQWEPNGALARLSVLRT
jgi:hypothetical protein